MSLGQLERSARELSSSCLEVIMGGGCSLEIKIGTQCSDSCKAEGEMSKAHSLM